MPDNGQDKKEGNEHGRENDAAICSEVICYPMVVVFVIAFVSSEGDQNFAQTGTDIAQNSSKWVPSSAELLPSWLKLVPSEPKLVPAGLKLVPRWLWDRPSGCQDDPK